MCSNQFPPGGHAAEAFDLSFNLVVNVQCWTFVVNLIYFMRALKSS